MITVVKMDRYKVDFDIWFFVGRLFGKVVDSDIMHVALLHAYLSTAGIF